MAIVNNRNYPHLDRILGDENSREFVKKSENAYKSTPGELRQMYDDLVATRHWEGTGNRATDDNLSLVRSRLEKAASRIDGDHPGQTFSDAWWASVLGG